MLSLFSSSSQLTSEYAGNKVRFAGHLALYPGCFAHLWVLQGTNKAYPASVYQAFTGAPVRILAGENDDYDDDPQSCPKFVQALPDAAKPHFQVTVYRGAGHGWDTPTDRSDTDAMAHKGRGAT